MVIDALRLDFVEGAERQFNMPYTSSLIDGKKACLLTGKARPPTVTMPRIKVGSSFHCYVFYNSSYENIAEMKETVRLGMLGYARDITNIGF
jgi:hypothetical protein